MGLALVTPRPEAQRGGSVMLRLGSPEVAQATLAGVPRAGAVMPMRAGRSCASRRAS